MGSTCGGGVEFGQNGQKLHENILGAKQWGDMGRQANFWGSGGIPPSPPTRGSPVSPGQFLASLKEAVARRCSVKKVLFKILQNSQENTCARAEISKNTFFYRAPPVAASQLKNQRS